jgi:hypothetical protein
MGHPRMALRGVQRKIIHDAKGAETVTFLTPSPSSLKGRTAVGMWSDGDGEMSSRLLALQSRLAQTPSFSVSRALRCSPTPRPPLNHQKQVP